MVYRNSLELQNNLSMQVNTQQLCKNMAIQRHRRHVCIVFLQNLSTEIFKLPNCLSHGWLTLGVWGISPQKLLEGGGFFGRLAKY